MADPALASRVLAPRRPRLAEAWAAICGCDPEELRPWASLDAWRGPGELWPDYIHDPKEAWEALATRGAIPMDWIEDPRRRFDGRAPGERIVEARGDTAVTVFGAVVETYWNGRGRRFCSSHPSTIEACVALASDPEGVVTIEALAREIVGDIRPIVWSVWRRPPSITDERRTLFGSSSDVRTLHHIRAFGYGVAAFADDYIALVAPGLGCTGVDLGMAPMSLATV